LASNSDLHIAFIGAGNMAASLVQGLLASGTPGANIHVADPVAAQVDKLVSAGAQPAASNQDAVAAADVVVLAVKPQVAGEVVRNLDTLDSNKLLVSIAAGINLDSLGAWTNHDQPIVRCMPNTPALFGEGMTALYANPACSSTHHAQAEWVLNAAGQTLWVEQEQSLDAVTAVSGSGPAYFFLLMEAMIDSGVALGLSRADAKTLTLQTAYGAALMAKQSEDDPAQLRTNVTSPGGTTAAALEVMQAEQLPQTIARALAAADQRATELAVEFGGAS